jgi:hypothetical protein
MICCCKLRTKGKYTNATLISVYTPPEDNEINIKEYFYDELQRVLEGTPRSDAVRILGDLNAKLGREEIYSNISGKYTFHNITSPNGELLAECVIANNMVVMSTQFQHKEIHKGIWTAPNHNTVNQIDHVIINASKKDLIEDVRTMRGPNIDTDHYHVKTVIRQKVPIAYRRKKLSYEEMEQDHIA